MSTPLLALLIVLPALAGGVLVVSAPLRRVRVERAAPVVAVATAALAVVLAVPVALTGPSGSMPFLPSAPLTVTVDGLAAVVVVTVTAVTLLVLLAASDEIRAARARFFGLMMLFLAAVLLTVTAATLPGLLLAWEVMGATSYALIAHRWREDTHVVSGSTAFLVTRAGDLGLYLAGGALLAAGAGLGLDDFAGLPAPWLHVAAAGVLAATFGKAAQLPFAFWLSRAMDGPTPVSALLHSAAMVAMGGYLLLRLVPLLEAAGWAAGVAAWGGAITALVLGGVAVAQSDVKQTLAASTSSQLGFVVLGAATAAHGGLTAGTAHLIGHAAVKALLFLTVGVWLVSVGSQQLDALRGVGRAAPVVGVPFTIGALALAGVAPLSLWVTKDEVLAAAGERSLPLYLVALAAAVLTPVYTGKTLGAVLAPSPQGRRRSHAGSATKAALVTLAAAGAVLGVLALLPLGAVVGAPTPVMSPSELVLSGLLAAAVVALAALHPDWLPAPAWARAWLGLEAATHAVVVRPVVALARALARFDDRVLEAATHAVVVRPVLGVAAGLAQFDDGGLDAGGVQRLTAGVRWLARLARRPQTGQLHHYYIQAVLVLVLAAALLVVLE